MLLCICFPLLILIYWYLVFLNDNNHLRELLIQSKNILQIHYLNTTKEEVNPK